MPGLDGRQAGREEADRVGVGEGDERAGGGEARAGRPPTRPSRSSRPTRASTTPIATTGPGHGVADDARRGWRRRRRGAGLNRRALATIVDASRQMPTVTRGQREAVAEELDVARRPSACPAGSRCSSIAHVDEPRRRGEEGDRDDDAVATASPRRPRQPRRRTGSTRRPRRPTRRSGPGRAGPARGRWRTGRTASTSVAISLAASRS